MDPEPARSTDTVRVRRCQVAVDGVVQGVGFRPFVYRLASSLGLDGSVRNGSSGLLIEVEGSSDTSRASSIGSDATPLRPPGRCV